jgi:hypothetical protein
MAEGNLSPATAQVVPLAAATVERRESYGGSWYYIGTRADLIASGVVNAGAPFPGDALATGTRGERFVDAIGRKCRIGKWKQPRHSPPTFRVVVRPTSVEVAAHQAERKAEWEVTRAAEDREKRAREAELLSPESYRQWLDDRVDSLVWDVTNGNATFARVADQASATQRVYGVDAQALLAMLNQLRARISAARIVSCVATAPAQSRPARPHLRLVDTA